MNKIKIKSKRFLKSNMKLDYKGLLPEVLERKRKNFVPEIEAKLLPFDKTLWHRMFPKKDGVDITKYQLTNIGKYSMIYARDSHIMSKTIKLFFPKDAKLTITDATANMGGTSMIFSDYFDKVNAVEILPFHCKVLANNLKNYNPEKFDKKIKIHCFDYLDIADKLEQDIVFFDPPWGGRDYINTGKCMDLYLDEISIQDIVKQLLLKGIKLVVVRVPKNYNFSKLFSLAYQTKVETFVNPLINKINYFTLYISNRQFINKHIKDF